MKFCDNPICPHHITILYGNRLMIEHRGERKELTQHLYKNKTGTPFYFCAICHNAIQMTQMISK